MAMLFMLKCPRVCCSAPGAQRSTFVGVLTLQLPDFELVLSVSDIYGPCLMVKHGVVHVVFSGIFFLTRVRPHYDLAKRKGLRSSDEVHAR